MNVVIGSAFRNAAGLQVTRWLDQVAALRNLLLLHDASLRAVAVEGDSKDATREQLHTGAAQRGLDLDLRTLNHGGPVYGSVESHERMAQLSRVGNEILDGVSESDNVLVYLESDLIWEPQTVIELINSGCDIAAPMVYAGAHFYDVWAYRGLDGTRFSPFPPYHPSINGHVLMPVSSVGSCLVMKSHIARQVRMTDGALVEWCNEARSKGYEIYVRTDLRIEHPA